ncbi:unnamed protein product [Symbiodinium sp. KB8]|nr:unnamed protein product [Symbiodinium sp. KB8]
MSGAPSYLQMVLFTTLVALKFNCLSMRAMNLAFACAMLLVSCLALPGMVDSNSMVCVSQFMFMFLFRLTCIPISGSTALVFLALGLNHWCLIWSLDIYLSEVKWYKAGRATEMYMALFSGVWPLCGSCQSESRHGRAYCLKPKLDH